MHRLGLTGACTALMLLGVPGSLQAQQIAIGGYPVPSPSSGLTGITAGPDGALWFTESTSFYGNRIGRITTAGTATEYPIPTANSDPYAVVAGPDGALWFTEMAGNKIGRITTSGVVTEYPIPTPNGTPEGITVGPDGALWFAEYTGNRIGRITKGGVITEYPVRATNGGPDGITAGPDGALWFTENFASRIGRITTAGVVTEYPLPVITGGSHPVGITAGPDGALWFAEYSAGNIGRITTAGVVTEYPVPTFLSNPYGITAGPDGALWFTELSTAGNIGRITTAGVITEYPAGSDTDFIVTGPDGSLWFTEFGANKIGQVVFVTAGLSVTPAHGSYSTSLTFTGSSFAPNERVKIYVSGVGSAVLARATADASGSFTATARAPQSVYGSRLFLGEGQSSGKLSAASFSVVARLILTPNSGPVGSTVVASGYGFSAGDVVDINWQTSSTKLGTVTADGNGAFSGTAALTFTVPSGAPTGANTVVAKGTPNPLAKATFTVQ